jgi:hypothetical protein
MYVHKVYPFSCCLCGEPQSTYGIPRVPRVYVPLLELGLPHPLSRKRVSLSPPEPKGGILACGEGGGSQFRRLEKKLSTLSTLCGELKKSNRIWSGF